jgi:hypothetical protein
MGRLYLVPRARRALARLVRKARGVERRVATLTPAGPPVGRALLSYIVDPFLLASGRAIPHSHTNFWESWRMARTLVELGFTVDVIHWTNRSFVPRARYDVLIDARVNLERLAPLVGPECLKIMHIETSHPQWHNSAQRQRLAALADRRGIRLPPFKLIAENRAIETADCATILGNDRTCATYRYAGKPLFPVPISHPEPFPFPENKDFDGVRHNFLWFGSGGLVHKGLDLVLDAFVGLPDFKLTVAGPVDREHAFERAYRRELYATPNVRTLGWIDVLAPDFLELARETLALVYPSCSEGQSGGVVTCLHAGLLPVVTPEVGVDIPAGTGVVVEVPTVDALRAVIVELGARPAAELAARARRCWEHAREHHTRERFAEVHRRQLLEILARFRPALRDRIAA